TRHDRHRRGVERAHEIVQPGGQIADVRAALGGRRETAYVAARAEVRTGAGEQHRADGGIEIAQGGGARVDAGEIHGRSVGRGGDDDPQHAFVQGDVVDSL